MPAAKGSARNPLGPKLTYDNTSLSRRRPREYDLRRNYKRFLTENRFIHRFGMSEKLLMEVADILIIT